jgi:hypothetical protein
LNTGGDRVAVGVGVTLPRRSCAWVTVSVELFSGEEAAGTETGAATGLLSNVPDPCCLTCQDVLSGHASRRPDDGGSGWASAFAALDRRAQSLRRRKQRPRSRWMRGGRRLETRFRVDRTREGMRMAPGEKDDSERRVKHK